MFFLYIRCIHSKHSNGLFSYTFDVSTQNIRMVCSLIRSMYPLKTFEWFVLLYVRCIHSKHSNGLFSYTFDVSTQNIRMVCSLIRSMYLLKTFEWFVLLYVRCIHSKHSNGLFSYTFDVSTQNIRQACCRKDSLHRSDFTTCSKLRFVRHRINRHFAYPARFVLVPSTFLFFLYIFGSPCT